MAVGEVVAAKENVVICAGAGSVTILPSFGGKIASFKFRGHELLQAPLATIAPRNQTMRFEEGDAGGWDECLPSVAPCAVDTAAGPADIPDHGDLWRVPWTIVMQGAQSVVLSGKCFSLPLTLQRSLTLAESESGVRITLAYLLSNTGNIAVPWSWAAHPLFAVEPGDRIVLPDSIHRLRVEGSADDRLGKTGDEVRWPVANVAGSGADLRVAQPADLGIGDKLFAGPLTAGENWCALERRFLSPTAGENNGGGDGVRIRFQFDTSDVPFLGLWICYGGWPKRPGPKQMCVALEPATAPVDSLALSGKWARTLAPGASQTWSIHVDLEDLTTRS